MEAEPYSSADFQHGPIALVGRGFPVMAIVAAGPLAQALMPMLKQLKEELLADLLVISNVKSALDLAEPAFAFLPISPRNSLHLSVLCRPN